MEKALELRDNIREAFMWLYANSYRKEIEQFLHDIQKLVQMTICDDFHFVAINRTAELNSILMRLQELDGVYFESTKKHIVSLSPSMNINEIGNLIRNIAVCLLWDFKCVFWKDEEVPQAIFHADKNKIREGVLFLYRNGYKEDIEQIVWMIKRVVDTAISQKYRQGFGKNNSCIHNICVKAYRLNKVFYKEKGEYCFRKCDLSIWKDKRTFAGEIAAALLWDET